MNSDDAPKAAAAADNDANDAGPKRPLGIAARPKEGVQHPDLDKAWAEYEAAISKASDPLKAAISKQLDAAAAKGDLDGAEKWQTSLEKLEKAGEVPAETETKAAVSATVAERKKAREELIKAYEAVVKNLTMEKKIVEARAIRNESQDLAKKFAEPSDTSALPDRRKGVAGAAREIVLTIHLTADWGSVTLRPSSAVEIGKQEVLKGGQQCKVIGNKIELRGQPFVLNDSTVRIMCRLKGTAKELILETHKGDSGALYVEALSRGEVLGQFTNEGNHGGNWRLSDSCRQEFKVVLP